MFGSTGNLGPIWVEAAKEQGWNVIGLGLVLPQEKDSANLDSTYLFDLSNFDEINLSKLLLTYEPHAVIFNSGIDSPPGQGSQDIQSFELSSFYSIFEVNFFGFIKIMSVILSQSIKPQNIIVVGSMYATLSPNFNLYSHFNNNQGSLKHPGYGASKAALKSIVKQYAATLAKDGIRVNMLSPGGVQGNQDVEFIRKFSDRTPMARLAKPHELKSAMKFLLDDDNSYLTGQNIDVDGGYNLW